MTRPPVVAGQFYAGSREKLREQLKACFLDKRGPGLPAGKTNAAILGAIVPHAGYMYSGPCAAHAYKALAEARQPDLFVILGPNHTGLGRTSVLLEDFETPLGIAEVDRRFGEQLLENTEHLQAHAAAHSFEHSIEVQLPFLQFALPEFRFLPVVVSSPAYIAELAAAIRKTAEQAGKRICVIASSDFTHYGANYGFVPFDGNVREGIEKLDKDAIGLIKKFDAAGFHAYIRRTGATICGYMPILALLKTLQAGKAELLCYYLSGDLAGDYDFSVSYAALVFS